MIFEASCRRTDDDKGFAAGVASVQRTSCRECRFCREMKDGLLICSYMNYKNVAPEGFCAWGEHK